MSGDGSSRDRRAAGRERRRQTGSDAGAAEDGNELQLSDALKAAASSAAVAAAVGAARAFVARRHEPDDERDEHEERDTSEEELEGNAGRSPEAYAAPEQETAQDEPVAEEQQEEEEHEDEAEQPEPASPSELRSIVARARESLRVLRDTDAEAVSSVRRSAGGWVVGLEVVEVRRIPDSTDVLATYEVELDGEGRLVRFDRTRRYHRSEAAGGGPG